MAGPLRAVIAPHIDLRRGGPCVALAYRALLDSPKVKTVIVLGTSHACPDPDWIVSDKVFDTPLGEVPVDTETVRRLAAVSTVEARSLFYHRNEHSVEFQALFLASLRAQGHDVSMVPVVCGAFADGPPEEDPFLTELAALLRERDGEAIVIAGADLAHVGPRFGDPDPLQDRHLELLEKKDRATLKVAADGDAAGFFASVTDAGDPRRICGLSPIYGLLSALPSGAQGRLLRYEQANDPTGTVSYASMSFWGGSW